MSAAFSRSHAVHWSP